MRTIINNLDDYDFSKNDLGYQVEAAPRNYWDSKNKKVGDWPGLSDDSYVWDSLRRYGNTVLGYKHAVVLFKHVWHKKYSRNTPPTFMTDKKYAEQYQDCVHEVEKYISCKCGFPVRIRFVKDSLETENFKSYLGEAQKPCMNDFWIIERAN